MAKSIEHERSRAQEAKDLKKESSDDDEAAFLRSLDQKQAIALRLTEELAVWFGDHHIHPIRLS